jgi:hypothetical protein
MRNVAIAIGALGMVLSACGGTVAPDPMGSLASTPAAVRTTTLASGADVCPVQLAAVGGTVAWTNRCAETAPRVNASVLAVSSEGGQPRALWQPGDATDLDVEVRAITSDASRIYFSVANSIYAVDPSLNGVTRVGLVPASHDVQWIALRGSVLCASVSIAPSHDSALDTIDISGDVASATVLTAASPETYGVVANSNGVYWSNGSLVLLDSAMHASQVAIPMSRALAADPSGGFFVVRADVPALVNVSASGNVANVASVHDDSEIAVDDTSVFVTAGSTIVRIAKSGGTPTLFAVGTAPRGLVTDATHLYWIDGNSVISAEK